MDTLTARVEGNEGVDEDLQQELVDARAAHDRLEVRTTSVEGRERALQQGIERLNARSNNANRARQELTRAQGRANARMAGMDRSLDRVDAQLNMNTNTIRTLSEVQDEHLDATIRIMEDTFIATLIFMLSASLCAADYVYTNCLPEVHYLISECTEQPRVGFEVAFFFVMSMCIGVFFAVAVSRTTSRVKAAKAAKATVAGVAAAPGVPAGDGAAAGAQNGGENVAGAAAGGEVNAGQQAGEEEAGAAVGGGEVDMVQEAAGAAAVGDGAVGGEQGGEEAGAAE